MIFLFVLFFWDSYDSNVGAFDIVPGFSEVVFISFSYFFFFPLCFIYFHHSIFHPTYPIFYLSYSTVGSLQSIFDLSCYIIHYSKVGPGLHVLFRSKWLRFRFLGTPQKCRLGWACVLCPSQVQAAQATRCLVSSFSPGGVEHLITHLSQPFSFLGVQWEHHLRCAVVSLLWGGNLWLQPTWQMSTIQDPKKTWLASGSLLSIWLRMPLWS